MKKLILNIVFLSFLINSPILFAAENKENEALEIGMNIWGSFAMSGMVAIATIEFTPERVGSQIFSPFRLLHIPGLVAAGILGYNVGTGIVYIDRKYFDSSLLNSLSNGLGPLWKAIYDATHENNLPEPREIVFLDNVNDENREIENTDTDMVFFKVNVDRPSTSK